ncbi:MAG TPA: NAD-dependent epimerase/dehydratase family protein [Candidatus Saccharimonadales bacterium]|nr:NAD-dependent epimerase/dehydratase family protein [Candidatus Saccharimonadales bacterium]
MQQPRRDWVTEYDARLSAAGHGRSAKARVSSLRDYYVGRPVLVTGGASFIGSHLVELLVAAGAVVRVADDLSSGRLDHLAAVRPSIAFDRGDLRDPAFARHSVAGSSVVFHLAAAHGGRGYIDSHPVECLNNISLDHSVFSAAAAAGCQKIVFASSACVYPTQLQISDRDRQLLREADAGFEEGTTNPDGEYGWAKLTGELQLRAFHRQHGVTGVACRIFTSYGERENETHAVVALIAKAVARLDPFPIWGNGLQTRNFTYVHDTAMGLALAGAHLDGFATLNVGSPRHHTILELVEQIFGHLGWRPQRIAYELDRPVGVRSRAADVTRCEAELGWSPIVGLKDGVARTTDWYARDATARSGDLTRALMER